MKKRDSKAIQTSVLNNLFYYPTLDFLKTYFLQNIWKYFKICLSLMNV